MPRKRVTPLSAAVDDRLYLQGKNRTDLADELGVTYQYLSNILSGRTMLPIQMSRKIGKAINIKDEDLRAFAAQSKRQQIAM